MTQQGRRRIDRVAAPDFLDEIGELPTSAIRTMRDECDQEERRLSYERRMLQGRIDIVRAERDRRRSGGGALIDSMSTILADQTPSRRADSQARSAAMYTPESAPSRRSDDSTDVVLGQLPELGDQRLEELLDQLVRDERAISDLRRRVMDHFDRLQTEVAGRVRSGNLDADEILRASGWAGGDQPQ